MKHQHMVKSKKSVKSLHPIVYVLYCTVYNPRNTFVYEKFKYFKVIVYKSMTRPLAFNVLHMWTQIYIVGHTCTICYHTESVYDRRDVLFSGFNKHLPVKSWQCLIIYSLNLFLKTSGFRVNSKFQRSASMGSIYFTYCTHSTMLYFDSRHRWMIPAIE